MTTDFDPRHPQQHTVRPFQSYYAQQFPNRVPPAASPPTKRPVAGKIVAGLVAAGLVLGGAGTWVALSSDSSSPAVQATSFAGADPTTSPFGTDHAEVSTVAATGPQAGDTAGLYAATTPPSCDDAAFLQQLQADPAKLAAWGGVFGLGAADVPAFVDSLSPVVLRAATSVTDHPFREGAFVEEPVVLAPGTAVLVNSYGEPTVKCFNGNPLSAGPQAAAAVTIAPTTRQIVSYHFTTIDNSRVVVVTAKPDPKPVPGPNKPPTTIPTPDPVLVKKAEDAKKQADQARQDATDARAKADDAGVNARVFRSEADRLADLEKTATARATAANGAAAKAQADLNNAFLAFPPNPARVAQAQAALNAARAEQVSAAGALATAHNDATKADQEADTAESQLKNAEAKARNDENVAAIAEENARKAKEAADASAKESAKPADPQTLVQTGQGVEKQAPPVPAAPAEPAAGGTAGAGIAAGKAPEAGTAAGKTAPGAGTAAATCPAGTTATASPVTDPATQCAAATGTGTTGTGTTGSTGTGTAPKAKDTDTSGSGSQSTSSTGSSTGSESGSGSGSGSGSASQESSGTTGN